MTTLQSFETASLSFAQQTVDALAAGLAYQQQCAQAAPSAQQAAEYDLLAALNDYAVYGQGSAITATAEHAFSVQDQAYRTDVAEAAAAPQTAAALANAHAALQSLQQYTAMLNADAPAFVSPGSIAQPMNPEFIGSSNIAAVARLYVAAFDRLPDADGLTAWTGIMAHGATQAIVAADFLATPEGMAHFNGSSNAGFVASVYTNVLGRAPDAAGSSYWSAALDAGQLSRGSVLASFANSSEFHGVT